MMTPISRRNFIKLAGLGLAVPAIAACNSGTLAPVAGFTDFPAPTPSKTWRVLNRISFGPRPDERARAEAIGIEAFIEAQLSPESIDEDFFSQLRMRHVETIHMEAPSLFDVRKPVIQASLQQATLLRAVYSRRQLYEVMVNFWSDHFNIDQTKGDCAYLKTVDDRDVIRKHALGNFRDLLFASAHSSAMMVYLDNQENRAGNPNENYARELMELHTLGVDGGYSQKDVQEMARTLTGWGVKRYFYRGDFGFAEKNHDNGEKIVFGLPIPADSGISGGEAVLEMLATHPATAHFIATKLVRRFIADDPPQALVARAAETFLQTRGDIKSVLRIILFSDEMLRNEPVPRKLKRPFNFVVSALRQLNARTDGDAPVHKFLTAMGQPLFEWATPDGYPDRAEWWSGSLFNRWRFASALAENEIKGTTIDLNVLAQSAKKTLSDNPVSAIQQFAVLLFGQPLADGMAETIVAQSGIEHPKALLAALLGAPNFQWK